ncbi:MAG TPA: galactose-1-phosphate uridylyltransferase [Bryobacteraceae bacterium]|jgi:UDPglucose--hexose-1-phosphate uridylyltransferase|nr:galactose-1-phosphate uridylyltransferase [Bryobacteraceae bacterium]
MPELRKDPITDSWVIISTDRARRPSDFVRETTPVKPSGRFCPFCSGHEGKTPPEVLAYRDGSGANQPGWSLRVVPNKFPVLGIEGDLQREGEGLFDKMQGIGAHEVIVETPEHALSMTELSEKSIQRILWAFRDRVNDLRNDRRLRYILLFKNHGEAAGATLEHTHSQLIALPVVPKRVQEEIDGARHYYDFKERCIFCDLIRQEAKSGERVVLETERFIVIEPYAARFPFETWILPKHHKSHFEETDAADFENLAWTLKSTLRKIEKVLEMPPYNLLIHTAPPQEVSNPYFHWHIEIIPKLTRVAGFEWGTGFHINPTPPEESAQFLREAGLA